MKIRHLVHRRLAIVALQISVGVTASGAQQPRKVEATTSQADSAYGAGIRAMNEGRWEKAISSFSKAASDADGVHSDASLYWEAYSYRRLALLRQSMQTCDLLRSKYPDSTWNHDCEALLLEMKQNSSSPSQTLKENLPPIPPVIDGVTSDESVKLLALNALLRQSPVEGVAAARRMLESSAQPAMKQQVLFVLTQSPVPDAVAVLKDAVRGTFGTATQAKAIREITQYSSLKLPDMVLGAYQGTRSKETKEAAIDALTKWGEWSDLVGLAKAEHDPVLRRRLVAALSRSDDPIAIKFLGDLLQ